MSGVNAPAVPRTTAQSAEGSAPIISDNAEVQLLLKNTVGRTKLFILPILNCGMTQTEIADLRKSEVDLKAGRIIRQRSKTDHFESVPTVNYLLWTDTVTLLNELLNQGNGELALVNANGSALWAEQLDAEGNYGKTYNIRNAFFRLTGKLGLTKPLKSLKKDVLVEAARQRAVQRA